MELSADPGLGLVAFSAEAGSPDDDALRFLASWAATHEPADALATPDQQRNPVKRRAVLPVISRCGWSHSGFPAPKRG